MLLFRQLFDRDSSTYTYLLADEETREAILIDPVLEQMDRDLGLIRDLGLDLRFVLDTHVLADHITAAGHIARETGAQSVAGCRGAMCAELHVEHGDVLAFGAYRVAVMETPGHTDDSLSFRVDDRLFTGDALLVRGCGRTDFQNGNAGTLYDSLERLMTLPDETRVYPGHDYHGHTVTTIGEERRLNPRFAEASREQFVETMENLGLGLPKRIHEAVPSNRACGLDQPAASRVS